MITYNNQHVAAVSIKTTWIMLWKKKNTLIFISELTRSYF